MSKRKNNQIITIVLILFAVVAILPLFISVMKATSTILGTTTTLWTQSGLDIISAAFSADGADLNSGAGALYLLGSIEDNAFVVGVYQWSFIIAMAAAAGALVMSILNLLNIRLTLLNKLFAIVLGLASLVALIFAFIVAGKFSIGTGAVSFGIFLLIAGIAYAGLYFYNEQK